MRSEDSTARCRGGTPWPPLVTINSIHQHRGTEPMGGHGVAIPACAVKMPLYMVRKISLDAMAGQVIECAHSR